MNKITKIHNLSNSLYKKNIKFLPVLFKRWMRIVYSCEVPFTCEIDKSVVFAHNALGVVINSSSKIGKGTIIYQNVTIGNRNSSKGPQIGEHVLIGANAVIIGDIKIGDYAKIGAGAIITKDVPPYAVMINESAKILR